MAVVLLVAAALFVFKSSIATAQTSCDTTSSFGKVTQNLTVPDSGTYKVWVRLWVPDGANKSLKLQANSICKDLPASGSLSTNSWVWTNKDSAGGNLSTSLNSNTSYPVVLSGQASGVRVDRVLILSDSCTPSGTGDNCTTAPEPPTISVTKPTNGQTVNGNLLVQFSISDTGQTSKVELLVDGTVVSNSSVTPFDITWDSRTVGDGSHTLRARLTDIDGNSSQSDPITINVSNSVSGGVTSRIPIDSYKAGGEGVGYHDLSAGNNGDGQCRGDDVDLKAGPSGCILGWFETGEWLEYDVVVGAAGSYEFRLHAASASSSGRQFHIELDGSNISGTMTVPNTGSYDTYTTVSKTLSLPVGQHTLRLVNDQQHFDVAWMEFVGQSTVSLGDVVTTPPASDITSLLPADAYRAGGEGVGYHDDSSGNSGDGQCRGDDVDLKADSNGCIIGWFRTNEWVSYDVSISQAGTYTFQVNAARGETGAGGLRLEIDNKDATGRIDVPSTGDWSNFETINAEIDLPSGDHTLKLFNVQQHYDVRSLQFIGPGTVQLRGDIPTPPAPDTTPPSAPGNLRVTNTTTSSVSLLWDESIDSGSGVVGYAVYRDGVLLLAVPSVGFSENNLLSNSTYRYQISALDARGNESTRTSIEVKTKAEDPAQAGPTADLNNDGQFNSQDLAIYKTRYQRGESSADFDGNGQIDVRDWALFLAAWKEGR